MMGLEAAGAHESKKIQAGEQAPFGSGASPRATRRIPPAGV